MIIYSAQQLAEIIVKDEQDTGEMERETSEVYAAHGGLGEIVIVNVFHENAKKRYVVKDMNSAVQDLQSRGFSTRQIELLFIIYDEVIENAPDSGQCDTEEEGVTYLTNKLAYEISIFTDDTDWPKTKLTSPEHFRYGRHIQPEH